MRYRSLLQTMVVCWIVASLSACNYNRTLIRSKHYSKSYRTTDNFNEYGCDSNGLFRDYLHSERTWKVKAKCLLWLPRELETTPHFPIGSQVRILEIKKFAILGLGIQQSLARIRIGEGPNAVEVFADWPEILDSLEETAVR